MSDINWGSLGTGMAVAFIAFMQVYQSWKQRQQATKQDEQTTKIDAVHSLVNSGMREQLQIGMVAARTLANVTNAPEHLKLADVAEQKYNTHVIKEGAVTTP